MGVWKYNLSFWLKKTIWLVQWTSKQESSPIPISAFDTWTSKIKGCLYLLIFKGFSAGCLGQVLPTSSGSVCHFVKQYVQVTMETTILILNRSSVRKICFWTINFRKKDVKIIIVNMNCGFHACLSTGWSHIKTFPVKRGPLFRKLPPKASQQKAWQWRI